MARHTEWPIGKHPGRGEFAERIVRGHSIDRHDYLIAAQCRRTCGVEHRPLCDRSGYDHSVDVVCLEDVRQIRVEEFVSARRNDQIAGPGVSIGGVSRTEPFGTVL